LGIGLDLKMKFISLIADSIRFAAADWYNVLILGLTLFLIENIASLPGNPQGIDLYDITFWLILGFLIFMEAGYLFRIIHETVNGSVNPPLINKLREMFLHGFKEIIVFFIYFSIPIIILAATDVFDFEPYLNLIYLNPHILAYYLINDLISFYLIPNITNQFNLLLVIIFSLTILVTIFIYFIYLCALLNMARHNGTIHSGLDYKGLYRKLVDVGVKNLLVVFIFLSLVVSLLGVELFSHAFEFISFDLYDLNVVDLLIQLLLVPFLLTLTIRLLGLIDKSSIKK
jgi:hypothetical protein